MSGRFEVLAHDLGEGPRGGPDADCRHRGQELVMRMRLHQLLDPGQDFIREFLVCASAVASWGSTSPAASVPATITVCSLRAEKIASAHRPHARGACLRRAF